MIKNNDKFPENRITFIDPESILFCEALGSSTKVRLINNLEFVLDKGIKEVESELITKDFFRYRDSFIVNIKYLEQIEIKKFISANAKQIFSLSRRK